MSIEKIRGEHFLEIPPEITIRACVERMRDEGCSVALISQPETAEAAHLVLGAIDASVIQALVLGQPACWDQPAGSLARKIAVLPEGVGPEQVAAELGAAAALVVVLDAGGKARRVFNRSGWLSYLNITRLTAVFNPVPTSEAVPTLTIGASR